MLLAIGVAFLLAAVWCFAVKFHRRSAWLGSLLCRDYPIEPLTRNPPLSHLRRPVRSDSVWMSVRSHHLG